MDGHQDGLFDLNPGDWIMAESLRILILEDNPADRADGISPLRICDARHDRAQAGGGGVARSRRASLKG